MILRGVALNLQGPMQAWGGSVMGDDRPTQSFPTRSGVLGLVASCMGVHRRDISSLVKLSKSKVHIGVETSMSQGTRMTRITDYHTVQGHPDASGARQCIVTRRSYLCDASFIAVVVPSDPSVVDDIVTATLAPVFSPYLGRRCCVLTAPLHLGVVAGDNPIELVRDASRIKSQAGDKSTVEEFYLDEVNYPGAIRRFPLRDVFCGPLQRQYQERIVSHVRTSPTAT